MNKRLPRVLIAEDLDDTRELYRRRLQDAPFRTDYATNGEEAVAMVDRACKVEGDGYDLVLLDGKMPQLSGLGAAEKLLQDDPRCDVRVYFLTDLDADDPTTNLRIRLMNLDPNIHLIQKHQAIPNLEQLIGELLTRSEAAARGASGN